VETQFSYSTASVDHGPKRLMLTGGQPVCAFFSGWLALPEQLQCEYAAHSIDIVFPRWVADDAPRILARRLLSIRPTKVTSGGCRLFRHLSNHAFAVDPRNVLRECLRRRRYFPSLAAVHIHTVPSLWQWLADIFILSLRPPHTEDIAHTLSLGNFAYC
jgi:hypothetical protein